VFPTTDHPVPAFAAGPLNPLAWVGRQVLGVCGYLGGVAGLLGTAKRSLGRAGGDEPTLSKAVTGELGWMLAMGAPLVAVAHVGLGSSLAMQSYFGGTFVDGTGAVVGVGLFRNIAPLMSGLILAGLIAARVTPELRERMDEGRRRDRPESLNDAHPITIGPRPGSATTAPARTFLPVPARAVAAKLAAATVAGPVLGFWAAAVGTLVGWRVAATMLGVTTHSFFLMFWEMIWARDLAGVLFKGMAFGLTSALFACQEGLRSHDRGEATARVGEVAAGACRAACYASIAILVLNSGWFIVVYHAGPAFGPTLLPPGGP